MFHHPAGRIDPASPAMEDALFAWCRVALKLCGCDREMDHKIGAPQLKCYYDLDDQLVRRQLEFRRMRKTARDASYNSLSSLGTVGEEKLLPRIQSTPDFSSASMCFPASLGDDFQERRRPLAKLTTDQVRQSFTGARKSVDTRCG